MGRMLISRDANRYAVIDEQKVRAGHFLTKGATWLTSPVLDFIRQMEPTEIVDPFAGEGDLLRHLAEVGFAVPSRGFDLHAPGFEANDSLLSIPPLADGLIVTNPPYLARHSAARKGVLPAVRHYYDAVGQSDLYAVGLRRCLDAAPAVVAIIPETFLHAGILRDRLARFVVIEESRLFADTTCPVGVACFGPTSTSPESVRVFLDDEELGSIAELDALRRAPQGTSRVRFNDPEGLIALRAVDGVSPSDRIGFMQRHESLYDPSGIKVSSRLMTYLAVDGLTSKEAIEEVIVRANAGLAKLRSGIGELALSPFKGNNSNGKRRRRLDYRQARHLLTEALG